MISASKYPQATPAKMHKNTRRELSLMVGLAALSLLPLLFRLALRLDAAAGGTLHGSGAGIVVLRLRGYSIGASGGVIDSGDERLEIVAD